MTVESKWESGKREMEEGVRHWLWAQPWLGLNHCSFWTLTGQQVSWPCLRKVRVALKTKTKHLDHSGHWSATDPSLWLESHNVTAQSGSSPHERPQGGISWLRGYLAFCCASPDNGFRMQRKTTHKSIPLFLLPRDHVDIVRASWGQSLDALKERP